jgi:DNA-binding SARP family transcriptional activator
MEIRLLGPVQVRAGGRWLSVGAPQRRAVLAALALDAGRPLAVETLVDRVWGEQPPAQVRSAIYAHVTGIRRLLREASGAGDGPESPRVVHEAGGYIFEVDRQRVDLHRFRQLVAASRDGHRAEADRAVLLQQALDLWQGAALTGVPGEWAVQMRDSWALERLDAAVDWALAQLQLGRHEQVIGPVLQLLADHQLAEPLVAVLMRALVPAGRPAEALDCYRRIRERLAEQLGADPGADLQRLHQTILRGELDPDPHARTAVGTPAVLGPAQLPLDVPGFTGRAEHLKRLNEIAAAASEQSTGVVIAALFGTAGVGKTALAVHLAHRVRGRFPDGQLFVNLRGFDPGGSVMAPAEAVRRCLDAFGVAPERIPADLDAQAALYRSLLADKRVLVVLDNARHADQVRPLLPGAPGCLVLVTSRNELSGLVAVEGADPLNLDLLSLDESRQMLGARLGPDRLAAEPQAVDEIIARCARLPLALAVVAARAATHPHFPLRTLAGQLGDDPDRLDALGGQDPASDVRAVFSWSYRALSAQAARLFRLLGLHPGPDISAAAAASLAGLAPPAARPLLAELTGAHVLVEHAPARYSFHDLLRGYAGELTHDHDTGTSRREAVHRMLDHYLHSAHAADQLLNPYREPITLTRPQPGVSPEEPRTHEAALRWFTVEHPVLVAAVEQASDAGFHTQAWQLAWTLAMFLDRRGHWRNYAATQHIALTAARRVGDLAGQARTHRLLGRAHGWLGRHEDAAASLRQALDLYCRAGEQIGQACAYLDLGRVFERQGRYAEALDHARRALALFRATGHRCGQAASLNSVGWCHTQLGDHEHALIHCEQALTLLQVLGDRQAQAETWDSLAHAHQNLGHHSRALACYQRSLGLVRELGHRYEEAVTLTSFGDSQHAAGNHQAARDAWQQALAILDELQHPFAATVRAKLVNRSRALRSA